ncbi:hypothetical protein O6H91_20G010000 [Diphasiastrum complanatum]|uniref:Uncharacterized protein n=1 Tax=Diphasiastrum complanatum TaxID=34168 RepID=A0ACC2AMP8_DIPCM|nr:hypothetical protein O6H91_20G010000 [Diphasiastrum complanatum]
MVVDSSSAAVAAIHLHYERKQDTPAEGQHVHIWKMVQYSLHICSIVMATIFSFLFVGILKSVAAVTGYSSSRDDAFELCRSDKMGKTEAASIHEEGEMISNVRDQLDHV